MRVASRTVAGRPRNGIKPLASTWTAAIVLSLVALKASAGGLPDLIFASGMEDPAPTVLLTESEASRFLAQTTFGPRLDEIADLQTQGPEAWLDAQMALPVTRILPVVQSQPDGAQLLGPRLRANWETFITADDQLRQRVAFALSEIMVVSQLGYECAECPLGMASYYDTLAENAFGNYRDLLEDATLHPVMGFYLSMLGNARADLVANTRADENFAREIMQLFSIGLVMLNPDGSVQMMDDEPIPTYNIDHVKELARVFTGWTWAGTPSWEFPEADQLVPMEPYREGETAPFHDYGSKLIVGHGGILTTTSVPDNQPPEDDLALALDTLFNHPNVGPFLSSQLIQKLVTSNPSQEYVARVSAVFADDGTGVRGNLAAVVRAILLDPEARNPATHAPDSFGKLREPILRLTHMWRSLEAEFDVGGAANNFIFLGLQLGQSPLQAPSVFNFYRPDYESNFVDDPALVAPEFQINTESRLVNYQNLLRELTIAGFSGGATTTFYHVVMDGDLIRAPLLQSPEAFIDRIDLLFFGGAMAGQTRTVLLDLLENYRIENGEVAGLDTSDLTLRAAITLYVALSSPQYLIQK